MHNLNGTPGRGESAHQELLHIVTQTHAMIFQNILPTLDSLNQSAK
jgi:hypothetical protein